MVWLDTKARAKIVYECDNKKEEEKKKKKRKKRRKKRVGHGSVIRDSITMSVTTKIMISSPFGSHVVLICVSFVPLVSNSISHIFKDTWK